MAGLSRRGATVFVIIGVGVLLAVILLPGMRNRPGNSKPNDDRKEVFRERALQSGLAFRMNFLPGEQGEKFKINLYDHGSGLAVGDYDGDGHEDIYFCNQLGENALYHNNGDGTFTDVTHMAGVALGDRICAAAAFADTRNNGRQDLFVTSTRGGNVFFRNQGDGTFKDATKEAGLEYIGHSQSILFFDYDNDGYLDLFVANTAQWTNAYNKERKYYPGKNLGGGPDGDLVASPIESNLIYHNNGDGTFTNVTAKAGVSGRGWCSDAVAFDYNGDGRTDLFVGCMFGPAQLYQNNGDGTFTEVTWKTLGATSFGTCGARTFDFNNDGKLDLYLADMHSDMWMNLDSNHESLALALLNQGRKYPSAYGPWEDRIPDAKARQTEEYLGFKPNHVVYGNTLFKNLGNGKFEEVSEKANLETFWPWGMAIGDYDNDGYEDAFLPSGMGYPFYYWPNQLRMNNGDGTFRECAEDLGIEPPERGQFLKEQIGGRPAPRSSRCAVTADFDGVGRLDIVVNNFNDNVYYFRNDLPRKNYVAFRLRGTTWENKKKGFKTSRDAIGAVVRLYVGKEIQTRQVSPNGGYLAQSSKTVHFGLGERKRIDRAEVTWPSGAIQQIPVSEINRVIDVIEQQ
jgi:hypothetical protein